MNLLAGHSTAAPLDPFHVPAFAPYRSHRFRELTTQTAVDRDPVILGPTPRLSPILGQKFNLDSGLLLSECNPDAFLAGRARHACRLLVLWLLQAGTHRVVDGC